MKDCRKLLRLRKIYPRQRVEHPWLQLALFAIAIVLMAGCGGQSAPPPTPLSTPLSTSTAQATRAAQTVTAMVTATVESAPTVVLTPMVTAPLSVLPTVAVTVTLQSPLTVTVAAVDLITDEIVSDAVSLTVDSVITGAVTNTVVPAAPCELEPDIALAAYPDLRQYLGCAQGPASFESVALNEFGPGPDYNRFMLWFSSENQIYVLLPDKTWQRHVDTWTEDQETFLCNPLEDEATSPPLPRRGFGKIWCTVEELQEVMGLVEREERLCQHTVTQFFDRGRLLACYEDATIRFFRIMDDGTWDQRLTQ